MILHKLRKFCPKCHSSAIRRVHRGFIKKYLFKQKPRYTCHSCEDVFCMPLLEKDIEKPSENILKLGTDKKNKQDKHTEYKEVEIIVE